MFASLHRPARHRLGTAVVVLALTVTSLGNPALASGTGDTGTGSAVDVEALTELGLPSLRARRAAAQLNDAIDTMARTVVKSGIETVQSTTPIRVADVPGVYVDEVDAALTEFADTLISALDDAEINPGTAVKGVLAAVGQVARDLTQLVDLSVTAAGTGSEATIALTVELDLALRSLIADTIQVLESTLSLAAHSIRAGAVIMQETVEALATALQGVISTTLNGVVAAVGMVATIGGAALTAVDEVITRTAVAIERAVNAVIGVVQNPLDTMTLSDQVDVALGLADN